MTSQLYTEVEKSLPILPLAAFSGQAEPIAPPPRLETWRQKDPSAAAPPLSQGSRLPIRMTSTGLVCSAHAQFIAALAGDPPRTIPLNADTLDLEDRADHIGQVFSVLSVYIAVILDDTAQNIPGTLDLPHVEAILADLAADVTGTIQHAAEEMGWRIA